MQASTMAPGAISDYSFDISQEAKQVFETALAGLTGVGYTPIAVATQLVAGKNYSFLCKAQPVYSDESTYAAVVNIYQPLKGDSHITNIHPLSPNGEKTIQTSPAVLGAYSDYSFDISQEAKQVFETALAGLTGVGYTPIAVATQIVAGKNYSFLCKAQPAYPDASTYVAVVNIYQPLKGDPHITNIHRLSPSNF